MNALMRRRGMMRSKSSEPDQPIGVNLIDSSAINGHCYLTDDGGLVDNSKTRTSDYIPVYFGRSYQKRTPSNRVSSLAVYDISKNFIRLVSYNNNQIFKAFVPIEGDAYIRLAAVYNGASDTHYFEFTRTA